MANRFYTILIVPEKTSQVRKLVVPGWILKGTAIALSMLILVGIIMTLDYWYVMGQIGENKQLKLENRRLRQQVQVFRNKMTTIESTMERVKTFATRLKVITNIEDRGSLLQSLNEKLPDAATNVAEGLHAPEPAGAAAGGQATGASQDQNSAQIQLTGSTTALAGDPDEEALRKESDRLDSRFSLLNQETLLTEEQLQDLYELLADQKAFLAALPTRKPAVGYFTSGFGVRRSPYGGKVRMHEGLDIANHPGTIVRAPADGVVEFADTKTGYGQTLIIDHGYGIETLYGHNRKLLVSKGQKVHRGDPITLLGNTGRSTGPHVHYEVRVRGWPVDPLSYILEN